MRMGYLPALSEQSKELMGVRDELRAMFRLSPDSQVLLQLKEGYSQTREVSQG